MPSVESLPATASEKCEFRLTPNRKEFQTADSEGHSHREVEPRSLKIVSFRSLLWVFVWVLFSVILFSFSWNIVQQFLSNYPVTIITYVQPAESPEPIVIKICNNVFLDREKILKDNGSTFEKEAYEFLLQAATGNDSFNDTSWVLTTPSRDFFLLSSRIRQKFKVDLDRFLIDCIVTKNYRICDSDFQWSFDTHGPCYEATIDIGGYGIYRSLLIGLYFDPDLKLGKYTSNMGAYISISHPRDHIGPGGGFFLEPEEHAEVLISVEHKTQSQSFEKAECVDKLDDLEWHNYTGKPFQTVYSPWICSTLCVAEGYYNYCNCSMYVGLNSTDSECLESAKNRQCLISAAQIPDEVGKNSKDCISKCKAKCDKSSYLLDVKKQRKKLNPNKIDTLFTELKNIYGNRTIFQEILRKIEKGEDVSQSISHVTIQFRDYEQEKKVEIIQLVSFSTAVSNIGGLTGIWLGLSAISAVELLEKLFLWSLKQKMRPKAAP